MVYSHQLHPLNVDWGAVSEAAAENMVKQLKEAVDLMNAGK